MKRRLLASILSLVMVLSLLPVTALARGKDDVTLYNTSEGEPQSELNGNCGANGDNVTWTLTGDEGAYTLTISGNGAMADYATGGAQPWVNQRAGVEHVVIGDGVTSIGERAFMGFSALKDVVIPDSVTSYGTNAFHSCTSLSTLNIGKNVSSIGQIGIYLDTAMTVLTIDAQNDSYAVIDNWLYELNDDGTAYLWQVPAGVVKDAATITVPDTIDWNGKSYTVVGVGKANADSYTLAGAASVTSVDLSSNVKEIGANAFHGAVKLENIDISRVAAIGTAAFKDCTKLTAATFADGLTTIGGNAFAGTGLTEVKLPAALTYLGKYVFSGCEDLKTVIVKSDTLEICSAAFNADKKLEVLDLSAVKNLTLDIKDPLAINRQDAVLLICYVAGETQKTLLNNQFTDGTVAFAVTNGGTFPEGTVFESGKLATPVKGNSVFAGWYENADFSGSRVTVPEAGKTYYAEWVDGVQMAGVCGEANNKTKVQWELTQNSDAAGTYTLIISGTGNMADFNVPGSNVKGIWTETAEGVAPWYTALSAAADATNHSVPITKIEVEDGVTGLGNWAFAYTQVTEAKFTSSVTRYGICIYSKCLELTTVDWNGFEPVEVKLAEGDDGYFNGFAIPGNIFDSDSKLNTCIVGGTTYVDTVAVPAEVVAVGTSGFYGTAFRTVDFENNLPNVKQIGFYSFASMQNLESLTIPGYMEFVLGGRNNNLSNAFAEEFSATSLVVGEGMEVLPASVAREWRSMQTLRLPSTLTNIGNSAFANAKQLHSVDMSKIVGPITVDISFNTYKSASGEFPVDCIFYVNNSDVQSTLAKDNWGNRNNNSSSSSRVIYAVTDGGTFSDKTVFKAGELATPEKEGYKFIGWYKDADFKTPLGDEAPVAGQTYYAKYGKSAELSTDIADKTFVVGADPVEFTISSMANADKDTKVRSYFTLVDANGNDAKSAIDTLDYLETSVSPNAWVDLKQFNFVFGPAAGYPLTDNAESHFRVTFNKAGTYTLTVSCKDVDNNNVVCSKTVTITVDPKSIAVPAADGTQFVYTGSAQTYNIAADAAYTVTGNVQTDAGTYTVTVSLKDKANTVWAGGTTADKEYTFTIAKAAGSVTAPTAKELTYTGEAQELVDAGSSDTGTIQYRLDNGEYSENVPMATSAGTYTVYYKVIGDANHNDVAEESITVTIAKAGQDKPAAPTLRDRSYTSITLNEVAGAEYSKDGGKTWQSPPEFTGLTSGTTYEFVIRYAATDNYNASPASDAVKFTTRRHSSATVTPTPTPEPEPTPDDSSKFADVPANAYFADAVKWAVDKGITNGLTDTMFGPYESCTRAQIVTFLWRAAGSPEPKTASSFTDVPASAYYAKAVAWAVENGITNGMTATMFAPDATCTRGQSVTFLYRALKGTASGSANFTDVKSDAFYADAINWAVANNVTNGTSNTTFSPNADCTRAEIVTFLYRAYQGK